MGNIQTRMLKNGKLSHKALVRLKEAKPLTQTFRKITDAKKWIQKTETEIREGRYFDRSLAIKHTLGEALDYYSENVFPRKPPTAEVQRPQLKWWNEKLGKTPLSAIDVPLIVQHRNELSKKLNAQGKPLSPSTVNRYMILLSHVYTIIIEELHWLTQSPCALIKNLKEPEGRVRYLSKDELKTLLSCANASGNKYIYLIIYIALTTGMRRNEIRYLVWGNINFENDLISISNTKNKKPRTLLLYTEVKKLLLKLKPKKANSGDFVFLGGNPLNPYDFKTAWYVVIKHAKIDNFRFHDLRHTYASFLAINNNGINVIADALGHQSLEMAKRYAHLSEEFQKEAINDMTRKVFKDVLA